MYFHKFQNSFVFLRTLNLNWPISKVWASYPPSRYEKKFFCSTENTLKCASSWVSFWCHNIQGG